MAETTTWPEKLPGFSGPWQREKAGLGIFHFPFGLKFVIEKNPKYPNPKFQINSNEPISKIKEKAD